MSTATSGNPQIRFKKGIGLSLVAFTALTGLTWLFLWLKLDIRVADLFYSPNGGWIYQNAQPWKALYQYGTIPGLMLTLLTLGIFFGGFLKPELRNYQKGMLVVVLTTILGAGVLVNAILKPWCGRPRPREIIQYKGQWNYCAPCTGSTPGKGMSFPCGHCSMGFVFVTLIYCRSNSKKIAYGGCAFGLVYGVLMGVARAAQGAHFATDTLWSLGVIVIVSLNLHYIAGPLIEKSVAHIKKFSIWKIALAGTSFFTAAFLIAIVFLTRRPYYEIESYSISPAPHIQRLVIQSNVKFVKTSISYEDRPVKVSIVGQGFGWVNAKEHVDFKTAKEQNILKVQITALTEGYFPELRHQLLISLPLSFKDRIKVEIDPN
ncbi:MAG: phosphatase PAP2 family protein [Desulfobacteraceae bacterium]|nr:phosphatase PAP2 family protein [Desulfobacteraceae bacterium]